MERLRIRQRTNFQWKPEPERCGWFYIKRANTALNGRPFRQPWQRSAARRTRCMKRSRRPSSTAARSGTDHGYGGQNDGAGTREPKTSPSERDFAQGECAFCDVRARPPAQSMTAIIDNQHGVYGVEPICKVLRIAKSTYHGHSAKRADPETLSPRARQDMAWRPRLPMFSPRTSRSTGGAISGDKCCERVSPMPLANLNS